MSTPPRRDRRTVLNELAAAMVDQQAAYHRAQQLVGELAGIDDQSAQLAMLRAEPDPLYIPLKEAARIAGCTVETMKDRCREFDFGWRPLGASGGPGHWIVAREAFLEWLKTGAKTQNSGPKRRKTKFSELPH